MKRVMLAAVAVVAAAVRSEAVYEINVASGQTRTIDAGDVAALAGKSALVKTGLGTLVSSALLGDFGGEIRIEAGVFTVPENGSLGTKDGATRVLAGATLVFDCPTQNGLTDQGEQIYIAGSGAEGYNGALVNNGASQHYAIYDQSCQTIGLTLTDDATIGRTLNGSRFDLRRSRLRMNGHTLTIDMNVDHLETSQRRGYSFYITQTRVIEPGHIIVKGGSFGVEGNYNADWEGTSENTLTVKKYAQIMRTESNAYIPWTLKLEESYCVVGKRNFFNNMAYHRFDGPIELTAWTGFNNISGTHLTYAGPVSGTTANATAYLTDGWLYLMNPANSYRGQTYFNGYGDTHTGGVAVCANGALPKHSLGAYIVNGDLVFKTGHELDLPPVAMLIDAGKTGKIMDGKGVMASLTKSRDGHLEITGIFNITGRTEIAAGSVRIAKKPFGKVGLLRSTDTQENSGVNLGSMFWQRDGYSFPAPDYVSRSPEMLEGNGKYVWTNSYMAVKYSGYVWNRSSSDVAWNFHNFAEQGMRVKIDNQEIFRSYQSTGFTISGPVTITPGAHFIEIFAYCQNNTGAGGLKNGDFPIGFSYDPLGRAETNAANFVAFRDPGDGSLFTQDTTQAADLDPTQWRTIFSDLNMTNGTLLDLNDRYEPVQVKKFSGKGVITNGVLRITERWTVAPENVPDALVVKDGDLILEEGMELDFGDFSGFPKSKAGVVIGKVDGTITGLERFTKPAPKWLIEATDQGEILLRYTPPGSIISLR